MDNFITPECYSKLIDEIQSIIKVQMPNISSEISIASSHGDLRENAQYAAAKERQRIAEARLNELEHVIMSHVIHDISGKKFTKVTFGAKIIIKFLDDNSTKQFQILSDYDSSLVDGTISINSPLVQSILGMETKDNAFVTLAGKERNVVIESIE